MKKIILFLLISKVTFSLGGIEIGTSSSVISFGNPAQAAYISTEAVFSNPSSTIFLGTGDYIYGGTLVIFPDYKLKLRNNTFLETSTSQFAPSLSYVHNTENYGFYFGAGSLGQGGFLKYKVSYNRIENLNVTSFNPGIILGFTYKLKDNLAIGLGGRALYSKIEAEGYVITGQGVKSKITATGFAPEISLFYQLDKNLNLGIKYLAETKLNYDGHITTDDGHIAETLLAKFAVDQRKDFPSVLSLGAEYKLNELQSIFFTYNRIFESKKKMDKELYHKFKDTNEYLFGFEQVLNEKFDLLLGYGYIDKGQNSHPTGDMMQLSAHQFNLGLRYKSDSSMKITFTVGLNHYDSHDGNLYGYEIKTTRKEVITGIGIEKKL
ncbi:hypothetical protein [Fusobacterium sp.]|uniref:OmpP1/FadL family transporter n=1 Tax=Fusobacterium sp. TaxID=68766 RepID=UPI002903EB79|nr:hypothetical protein [Fusobacterium sp.]MDU1911615.1 hypothetical protein [Fusobacterium sp.]